MTVRPATFDDMPMTRRLWSRAVGSENEKIIENAVEAFREGFIQEAMAAGEEQVAVAPTIPIRDAGWPLPEIRLTFADPSGYELLVGPEGEDGACIQVLGPNTATRARDVEHGYTSADDLCWRIDAVWRRAAP